MFKSQAPVGSVDFLNMTEEEMAKRALDAGKAHFLHLLGQGLTNLSGLHLRIGIPDSDEPTGYRLIGELPINRSTWAEPHDQYSNGMATTSAWSRYDSDDARAHGMYLPDGGLDRTGGVHYLIRDEYKGEMFLDSVVTAASGVQGVFDKGTAYAAATTFGACRILQWQAQVDAQ